MDQLFSRFFVIKFNFLNIMAYVFDNLDHLYAQLFCEKDRQNKPCLVFLYKSLLQTPE